jgi:hypothetical protein
MARLKVTNPNQIDEAAPKVLFVGFHRIQDGENLDTREFYGTDEDSVVRQICDAYAAEAIDTMPAASVLQEHVNLKALLENLRFTAKRAEEVSAQILGACPDELGSFSSYFTPAEIIRAYLRLNPDEDIEVIEYSPVSVSKFSSVRPANIEVIFYDSGMAISREGEELIGYFQLENVDNPHPHDYEWENGFQFEFITPDQAEVLRQRGHADIVDIFENRGAVCEG